jgi:hypothetical protein
MVKPHQFRVGDLVKVVQIPSDLHDAAGIGTPELFQRVLGKRLLVDGFGRYGHLELTSSTTDHRHLTIVITPFGLSQSSLKL